ncbi:MAG: GTPase ObgE [Ignavibacteriae bacterium]|nr:GTPase ObgE [Ignavibacteria bacterium]MBI3365694.1 GTPase ObgE [Ignavibacteriota bacterium]
MFIDQAAIYVKAGKGGDGVVSFRREKFIPKGGPDGGNGGNGGSVIIHADRQLATLLDFRYKRNYIAPNGQHGMGARKTGKSGDDLVIRVPAGTVIKDAESGNVIADLVEHTDEIVITRGGRGGKGNSMFATSTNQAPRKATKGKLGKGKTIQLELKLLADVGLVGFPNAGKSTLISRISAAKPKIADYPFTTLIPNLGIVQYGDYQSFVVADMPGLIEGAHTGKGLGIQFLRHIERTSVLVFMIESTGGNLKEQYETLADELASFNETMLKKPQIITITKMDLADEKRRKELDKLKFKRGMTVIRISSATGEGLKELLDVVWKKLRFKKPHKANN